MKTVMDAGLENVSDVVALEFVLTYIMPRCDTNEIAHRLLNRFGSFVNVLNADWTLLADIEGMGETSAKKLHLLTEVFDYFNEQQLVKKYAFEYRSDVADFFEELLRFKSVETTYLVGISASNKLMFKTKLATGGLLSVGISTHQIAKYITGLCPAYVFLAHNHPQGSALPSQTDLEGTKIISDLVSTLGVNLVDHIIVGQDGIYGIISKNFYRKFETFQ